MNLISINEFRQLNAEGVLVADTRTSENFCLRFIKNSVSVPLADNFVELLQEIITDEQPLLLIVEEKEITQLTKLVKQLTNVKLLGILAGSFENLELLQKEVDMLIAVDVEEFVIDYNFDEFFLIDVSNTETFEQEHIEHAENITIGDLEQSLTDMEASQSYYVWASGFNETVTAGSLFKRNGFERVRVIQANKDELKTARVPFVTKKKGKNNSDFPNN